LYQGKEWQTSLALNLYDFHARQYDPATGRMLGVDPQAMSFAGMSPYTGMGNNPLLFIDPDGEFLTWSFGKGGFSIGFNLSPIGIPLGAGINIGGGSAGVYGEVGYRVGGTGLGAGATVQQSIGYNFGSNSWNTTTTEGAYASFGPFNAGGSLSQSYDITNRNWSTSWNVSAGIGIGFENGSGGIGFNVSYGSSGFSYGVGGNYNSENASKQISLYSLENLVLTASSSNDIQGLLQNPDFNRLSNSQKAKILLSGIRRVNSQNPGGKLITMDNIFENFPKNNYGQKQRFRTKVELGGKSIRILMELDLDKDFQQFYSTTNDMKQVFVGGEYRRNFKFYNTDYSISNFANAAFYFQISERNFEFVHNYINGK